MKISFFRSSSGAAFLAIFVSVLIQVPAWAETLRIGSKRFTESYVLGEVLRLAADGTAPVEHRQGLGNTGVVYAALAAGAIDLYPDYTGTVAREILRLEGNPSLAAIDARLALAGLGASVPLGFANGYAIGLAESHAARLGLHTLSDLAGHPRLRLGLSPEFLGRADGWPGLARAYGLAQQPAGLDHGIAYEALAAGRIDALDLYTTDAAIARHRLRVLEDDRGFFPRYDAVILYRRDLPARFPEAWKRIVALEGRIDAALMVRMNAAVEIEGRSFTEAAQLVIPAGTAAGAATAATSAPRHSWLEQGVRAMLAPDLGRLTLEHLGLVAASVAAGLLLGLPLGMLAHRRRALAPLILGAAGVLQTVPSLALLAFLVALTGVIGAWPALIALALYALLPIVRNTHAGLEGVGPGLRDAARALGFTPGQILRLVELPLALPVILAGVRTAAVINVGTAAVAALVGAGGYGERIVKGLALNDPALLVAGALPSAVLALLLEAGFSLFAGKRTARERR